MRIHIDTTNACQDLELFGYDEEGEPVPPGHVSLEVESEDYEAITVTVSIEDLKRALKAFE